MHYNMLLESMKLYTCFCTVRVIISSQCVSDLSQWASHWASHVLDYVFKQKSQFSIANVNR